MNAADTSARTTKTQPVCPPWCQVSVGKHEDEACQRLGSWFAHERGVTVGDFATAWAISCQVFEEQMPGKAPEPIGFFVDVEAVELSAEQVLELADALNTLVKEVKD
jgi:hypothetical protein